MRTRHLVLLALGLLPGALHGQQVRARVIDADQRSALTAVQVLITDSAGSTYASAETDGNGFFTIEQLQAGEYALVLRRDGYRTVNQPLVIRGVAPVTLPAILMQSEAVVLDPVRAEGRRQPAIDIAEEEVRGEFVLAGGQLAQLEQVNASPQAVYRELGLRVRESVTSGGTYFCVGGNRGPTSMRGGGGGCEPIAVVVDGILVSNPTQVLRNYRVSEWESVEYLNAVEAGVRHGLHASHAGGAIVLWTRGLGPHRTPARDGM
ncbi:MAG TPA: carboxypeptidase-like regulatory domain-containing protein [Longimicrobiales bacterium]|nr:carboxypeptidase-like regulatory domain-containing protein [Longimicrobiales bacterium]